MEHHFLLNHRPVQSRRRVGALVAHLLPLSTRCRWHGGPHSAQINSAMIVRTHLADEIF
jgi:hypothetical protein